MTLDISRIVSLSGHARLYQELAADKNRSEEIEKLHRKVVICEHARNGEMPEIPNGGWLVGLKSGAARQRLQISCILAEEEEENVPFHYITWGPDSQFVKLSAFHHLPPFLFPCKNVTAA